MYLLITNMATTAMFWMASIIFLYADIGIDNNAKLFDINEYDSAKLYKCDQIAKKVVDIYDVIKKSHAVDVNADPDRVLLIKDAFLKDPIFFKYFIVLKNKTTGLMIISVVKKGELDIAGISKIKITSLVKDLKSRGEIEDFLKDGDVVSSER